MLWLLLTRRWSHFVLHALPLDHHLCILYYALLPWPLAGQALARQAAGNLILLFSHTLVMPAETPDCIVNLQAGTVTTKNSCSRNLHRLLSSISFISSLLQNLAADKACTLHTATASAYSSTMAPMHNFFVRTAVKGGMYTLPTRAGFLQSIGETGDCNWGIWPTFDPCYLLFLPLCDCACVVCYCVEL